jgi:hypothetical protein
MNRNQCEREREVVTALRTSVWTAELSGHVRSCAVCGEAKQVAESLLHFATMLRIEHEPSSADRIWRRAQAQRQEMVLRRATRPLIFMKTLSLGCVVVFALWLLRDGLSSPDFRGWLHGWAGTGLESAVVGAAIAVVCIALGAFYLLRQGREVDVMGGAS